MSNSDLSLGALREQVVELRHDIEDGKRQRRVFWVVMACMSVVFAVGIGLIAYSQLVQRPDTTRLRNEQHQDTQDQIRMLVCSVIPPGATYPGARKARQQYACPTFGPATVPSPAG